MATEYISREAAMQVLCDACGNAACPKGLIPKCSYGERMGSIPAADVRPVVRGRWEDETGYIFNQLAQRVYCPVCKSYAYFYPITTKNFCPNCGADMRPERGTKE